MEQKLQKLIPHISQTDIPLVVKVATITIATVVLFSQDLAIIFSDALQNETTSHLIIIPLLLIYLLYRKRKMLKAVMPIENKSIPKETRRLAITAGTLLLAIAILLYWHGSYTFTPLEYHMLALPIFVAGLVLILFNHHTLRQLAFPTTFLIFLMPPPSEILYALGSTLSVISSEASNLIVNLIGVPSTIISEYGNPTIVITRPDGTPLHFTVDIACSGIYSLIGFLIFAVFIAYIIRDKPWKKTAILIIGLPVIYLLNILRITAILLIGYYYGSELALQIFHLLGGWILIFLGTLTLLVVSEKIFKTRIFANPAEKCSKCNPKPESNLHFCSDCGRILNPPDIKMYKTDFAKISAIAVCLIMLTSIQAPVFTLTQTNPIVIINTPSGQKVSTEILPQIPGYSLRFVYRDTEFEALAKQDMAIFYIYTSNNQSKEPIWAGIEIASTHSSLHRWEFCLITWQLQLGYQPEVTQVELKDIQLTENPPIISRYFVYTNKTNDLTYAVLYWYETAIFTVNSTSAQKQAKISLIAYPKNAEDLPNIEGQLIPIATAIANYWEPIKTWSQIAILLSQNGLKLAGITSVLLAIFTTLYAIERRKQRKENARAYLKLSEENRSIIEAVHETKKVPTAKNIAVSYQEINNKPIEYKELMEKLWQAHQAKLINNSVLNINDEPFLGWKTQLSLPRANTPSINRVNEES